MTPPKPRISTAKAPSGRISLSRASVPEPRASSGPQTTMLLLSAIVPPSSRQAAS
jgi:hypothetical protein